MWIGLQVSLMNSVSFDSLLDEQPKAWTEEPYADSYRREAVCMRLVCIPVLLCRAHLKCLFEGLAVSGGSDSKALSLTTRRQCTKASRLSCVNGLDATKSFFRLVQALMRVALSNWDIFLSHAICANTWWVTLTSRYDNLMLQPYWYLLLGSHSCVIGPTVTTKRSQWVTWPIIKRYSQCQFTMSCNWTLCERQTHTGEKNFECGFEGCNKRFVKASHVTRHQQKCHPEMMNATLVNPNEEVEVYIGSNIGTIEI